MQLSCSASASIPTSHDRRFIAGQTVWLWRGMVVVSCCAKKSRSNENGHIESYCIPMYTPRRQQLHGGKSYSNVFFLQKRWSQTWKWCKRRKLFCSLKSKVKKWPTNSNMVILQILKTYQHTMPWWNPPQISHKSRGKHAEKVNPQESEWFIAVSLYVQAHYITWWMKHD